MPARAGQAGGRTSDLIESAVVRLVRVCHRAHVRQAVHINAVRVRMCCLHANSALHERTELSSKGTCRLFLGSTDVPQAVRVDAVRARVRRLRARQHHISIGYIGKGLVYCS